MIDPELKGALWLAAYDHGNTLVNKIALKGFRNSFYFHPLDINAIRDPLSGSFRLFVINHQGRHNATIEVFSLPPPSDTHGQLVDTVALHLATLTHAALSPNPLVALSPTSSLVTNDHRWPHRSFGPIWSEVETYLKVPGGWIDLVEFDDRWGEPGEITNLKGHWYGIFDIIRLWNCSLAGPQDRRSGVVDRVRRPALPPKEESNSFPNDTDDPRALR